MSASDGNWCSFDGWSDDIPSPYGTYHNGTLRIDSENNRDDEVRVKDLENTDKYWHSVVLQRIYTIHLSPDE